MGLVWTGLHSMFNRQLSFNSISCYQGARHCFHLPWYPLCLAPSFPLSWHLAEWSPQQIARLTHWHTSGGALTSHLLKNHIWAPYQSGFRGKTTATITSSTTGTVGDAVCGFRVFIILQRNVRKSHAWISHYTHTSATHIICEHCIVGAVSLSIGVAGRLKKGKHGCQTNTQTEDCVP